MAELMEKVIAYLIEHPGCVNGGQQRRSYKDVYRCFVLDLAEQHDELDLASFSRAVAVPLPTLRQWLRGKRPEPDERDAKDDKTIASDMAATARIETILNEWKRWEGDFVPFCEHLREHLHIPDGRTLIATILEQLGARIPKRRPGRSPDEKAMREAFETFFPGAQWEGDGSSIVVHIFGRRFVFNLELMVDAHSDAFVGCSVRDHEDAEAVIAAFEHGVETTATAPIVVELDGRPSNHAAEVEDALGDTTVLPSTPGRPQSNPHVEGAFGLFQQVVPELVLDARSPKEAARQLLAIVVMTWARTLNHRPRADREGRSRVQLYREQEPTTEQIEHARRALRERCRRQELAMATRRARQNPVVREVLDRAFDRLSLDDPKGNVRAAIARYPLDHVLAGLAIYQAKSKASTLPHDVDSRYLLGIIRNVSNKDEGQLITEALIRLRLEARDIMLEHLAKARQQLLSTIADPDDRLRAMIDHSMESERQLDRIFWLEAAAEQIGERPEAEHSDLVRAASRRIHATFAVPYSDRLAAVRVLTRKVVPLE